MGGSSIVHSKTPHPSREEQVANAAQASTMKTPCKRLFRPLCMGKYYDRKRKKNEEKREKKNTTNA
jgi:hypothetical protein